MKVVLLQRVPTLGERGDICDVADGHARNLLFPKKLAIPATAQAIAEAEAEREAARRRSERELAALQKLATQLDGYELEVEETASDAGTLYAAVGAQKVAQLLKERGFDIKKTQVTMTPIKTPGEYAATVRFDHGLEAELKLIVTGAP